MSLQQELIDQAEKWIGIKESGGANKGPEVEMFQKAVDNKAQGESWCMAFCQFCLQQVENNNNIRTNLFQSEHCMTVWNKSPENMRMEVLTPGCIVIWRHGNSASGHTGIVTSFNADNTFNTIEGNTGAGAGVVADGDGVYRRTRSLQGAGEMKVVGFLNPFVDQQ